MTTVEWRPPTCKPVWSVSSSRRLSFWLQVDQLNKENSELLRKMSGASGEDYERYRTTYENNKKKIADLQSQLDNINDEIV